MPRDTRAKWRQMQRCRKESGQWAAKVRLCVDFRGLAMTCTGTQDVAAEPQTKLRAIRVVILRTGSGSRPIHGRRVEGIDRAAEVAAPLPAGAPFHRGVFAGPFSHQLTFVNVAPLPVYTEVVSVCAAFCAAWTASVPAALTVIRPDSRQ